MGFSGKRTGRLICSVLGFSLLSLATAHAQCAKGGNGRPDLVIMAQGTSLKWSGKCTAVSPKIIGTITVKNIGQTDVRTDEAIVSFWDRNNQKCSEDIATSDPIKPGETKAFNVKACRFIDGKQYTGARFLHLRIDKNNKIDECNKQNNGLTTPIKVIVRCS